jgi:hypothetical protein
MRPPVCVLAFLLLTLPQLAIASDGDQGDQDVARLNSLLQQYSSLADWQQQQPVLGPEAYGCTPGLTDAAITTNSGIKAWMMPKTPIGSDGDIQAYSCVGTSLAVWGRATGGPLPITWSLRFGDGMMTAGTATTYAQANNISADHVYASAGWKTAVLTATDGLNNTDSAFVNIYVETTCDSVVIINSAIEKGLRWLYLNQCPNGRLSDGGGDYDIGGTGLALLAFHLRGHFLNDTTATSTGIYGFTVQKATDFLLSQLRTYSACMTSPYPDVNGDGLGLFFGGGLGYSNGMAIMGLASGYAQESAYVPRSGVAAGWPMSRVLQDCMEQIYNAQAKSGAYRGGWRYQVNTCDSDADNSLVQWAVLALEACKEAGFPVADSCRNELARWVAYSQCPSNGGFGYTSTCYWDNIAKTASGLMSLDFLGVRREDPRAVRAESFICSVWNNGGDNWGYTENLNGNFYTMYSLAKSCRSMQDVNGQQLDVLQPGNIDWYGVYWRRLTDPTSPHRQQPNGSWTTASAWTNGRTGLTTELALLTLIPAVIICRPVAVPEINPSGSSCPSVLVTLDGSKSFDQCPDRRIVEWLWDYDLSDNSGFFPDTSVMIAHHLYVMPPSDTVHTFTGALRVRDDQDSTSTMTFTVDLNNTNNAPIACAQVGCTDQPYAGQIGSDITFDGSSSFDPDACQGDSIAKYRWDLDGDGVYEDSSGAVVSRHWDERYIGQISLEVCDTHGLCSRNRNSVNVYASELNLSIQASDITFTPDCNVAAQDRVINAKVRLATLNNAATNLPETRVDFYDGNPNAGGTLIGQQFIPAGSRDPGEIDVNQPWTVNDPDVARDVYVIVDPQDVVWEFNESDNLAVKRWDCGPHTPFCPDSARTRIADNTPALDLKSRGEWIGFKVGPPMDPPCLASDLHVGSFMLNDTLPSAVPAHVSNVDEAEWGQHLYLVKFKRADVEAMFPDGGSQVVKISGMCEGVTAPISSAVTAPMAPACVPTEFCGLDTLWIIKPKLQMLTAGQTVDSGSNFPITWDLPAGQTADETSIHYSLDAGTTWTTVAEHYTGSTSFDWNVPAVETDSVILAVEIYRNGMLAGQDLSPVFQIANGITGVSSGLPARVYLSPPQPSPFGSSTVLRYGLPKAGTVKLSVLDITGRMVRTLVNKTQEPGNQTAVWNGQDDHGRRVDAGVYFYRLEGLGVVLSQKVVYLR